MSDLQPSAFPEFFKAIYGYDPFPWQQMLVERIAERGWPEGIDLPTASGKTACIDAAVFLLAMGEQEGRLPLEHPGRRRIFFVVDRRIVVDEAYERAKRLATKLKDVPDGIVKQVADRLSHLAGPESPEPLIVSRLRGGTVKDERWRLSPAQPAIITTTVDQLGSRLLFRSYGSSNLSAPIEAALTACDSLILLDEAHCAVPFMQTARAVQQYAGHRWMEGDPIISPLTFSILSATLPKDVENVFPQPSERDDALRHHLLDQRRKASKPAALIPPTHDSKDNDEKLIAEAVKQALQSVNNGRRRIAIMVNRVARASRIATEFRDLTDGETPKLDADVVLMTGRMRPIERDAMVKQWSPLLKAGSKDEPDEPEKPIILVTTQCLEVGADFSFDGLITECASLDALRQRFGRLNRLGEYENTNAAVIVRKADLGANADDPIYGTALKNTWDWLNQSEHLDEEGRFDFGISAVDERLSNDPDQPQALAAPSPDAPVMLPAHLDLLCQTAPRPIPDPDVALFLHGRQRNVPEARVVFRADLIDLDQKDWCDAVALLPPLTAEALTLPLWLIQKWLVPSQKLGLGDLSDVESQRSDETPTDATFGQAFVIWRGRRESIVSRNPRDVRPNETLVVPADGELAVRLGHAFCRSEGMPLDVAEQAYQSGRGQYVLRLLRTVYTQSGMPAGLSDIDPLEELLKWSNEEDHERNELLDLLLNLKQPVSDEGAQTPAMPEWLNSAVAAFSERRPQIEVHPAGGVVLIGPPPAKIAALDLDFGDTDDALSATGQRVPLSVHTQHVVTRAEAWAQRCLPSALADAIKIAARLHDLGKADPRWQQVQMYGGKEEIAAVALAHEPTHLFAKSNRPSLRGINYFRACEHAGIPPGFRHEMLSTQFTEAADEPLPKDAEVRALILHLIAAHHGYGRPFAPVCIDDAPPDVKVDGIMLTGLQRREMIPPHRLDSGVAERFWTLTRRYGWWGVAYLEAILRLADHASSAAEAAATSKKEREASG